MPRGKLPSIRVPLSTPGFDGLAAKGYTLDDVKRHYIEAVFNQWNSITATARICAIDTNTVYHYLGRDFHGCHIKGESKNGKR